jgi:hypothetical protein
MTIMNVDKPSQATSIEIPIITLKESSKIEEKLRDFVLQNQKEG